MESLKESTVVFHISTEEKESQTNALNYSNSKIKNDLFLSDPDFKLFPPVNGRSWTNTSHELPIPGVS
jgi:hypothetical protein